MGKLTDYLVKSKNPKGLKGFVKVGISYHHKAIWIPATIKGIEFGKGSCSLTIVATVDGGLGEFEVAPCQFVDSLDEVKRLDDIARRVKQAENDSSTIQRYGTLKGRKTALTTYVDKLSKSQLVRFNQELSDEGIEDVSKIVGDHLVRKYVELATKLKYDLLDVNEDEVDSIND